MRIGIYNTLGREIKNLVKKSQNSGQKIVFWDGTDDSGKIVGGGVYFYTLQTNDFIQTRKMLFIK